MPQTPPKPFEQDKNGAYLTDGLSESQFVKVFAEITRQQRKNRTHAKRTLPPQKLKRKSVEDLVKIGKKEDGTSFTIEDLKRFEKMRKQFRKRTSGDKGISYAELVANARSIDIKRANGSSNDGLGLSTGNLIKMERGNVVIFRVKASTKSKHENHRVKLRLEDWEEELENAEPTEEGYQAAVKRAARGRYSIECDCGKHQYWYRYMATVGGYQLGQPREMAYPKVRNPNLEGTACKHVLKAVQLLQSAVPRRYLGKQMDIQARKNGFTDSGAGATKTWRGEDQKELSKNRSLKISDAQVSQAKHEYARYNKRREGLQRQLRDVTGDEAAKLRKQLKRAKKSTETLNKKIGKLKQEREQNIKRAIGKQAQAAVNLAMKLGVDRSKAISAYASQSGLSEAAVKKALDNAN
ncbi:phage tail protein [Pseudoalteromonas ruthenica]|uniref:phage tail protein n=1 Tax=Pseudoalteromonas ruthenica TaxID=151081 RepID=UPI00110C0448|nr:phage tail protein [Pseudoalteromonas ruthenica]TMO87716.1 phage tail protein [Pseudoalteromonas ruthenica]TMP21521.1 phage tail protein [Pseudoalteromonas ruthenica]